MRSRHNQLAPARMATVAFAVLIAPVLAASVPSSTPRIVFSASSVATDQTFTARVDRLALSTIAAWEADPILDVVDVNPRGHSIVFRATDTGTATVAASGMTPPWHARAQIEIVPAANDVPAEPHPTVPKATRPSKPLPAGTSSLPVEPEPPIASAVTPETGEVNPQAPEPPPPPPQRGEVTLRVLGGESQAPIANARVHVSDGSRDLYGRTDTDGTVTLTDLPFRPYSVHAVAGGYVSPPDPVTVTLTQDAPRADLRMPLLPGMNLNVHLLQKGKDLIPLRGTVQLNGTAPRDAPCTLRVPPGEHVIEAFAPGHIAKRIRFTATPRTNTTSSLTIDLRPPAPPAPRSTADASAPGPGEENQKGTNDASAQTP